MAINIFLCTVPLKLCLKEKDLIFRPEGATLNSRSEIFRTRRHRKKITSRTTGAKGNKFLQVITSFNEEAPCSIYR